MPGKQLPPSKSASQLDALVVLNIIRTANQLSPLLDRDLRDLDLTSSQLNVLLLLHGAAHESLTLSEVGRRLVVTKANVTGLIDRLERKGLVKREDSADRRAFTLRLTALGATVVSRILPQHEKVLAEVSADLGAAEKQRLVRSLTKLRASLRRRFPHVHSRNHPPAVSGQGVS